MFQPKIYTVESVTSGHPDKLCDQISDAILDECLKQDPLSRVAVETAGGHGLLLVIGEVTTNAQVDYAEIARNVYANVGYEDAIQIHVNIVRQSPDIAQGVNVGGAGDQGIMYGYATEETPQFLPRGVVLVHGLTKGLEELRKSGRISWLRPDGKAQVTLQDGRVSSVLVSCQHAEGVSQQEIRQTIIDYVISPLLEDWENVTVLVNPTGKFVRGGLEADTGLTGRKIMVDTYGGFIPHGGGCFSGKDPTKVDRSAAYMARFAAKNIVANGLAKQCLVSVAYAIGRENPVMVEALDEGGEGIPKEVIEKFDFRPAAIIERLGLRQPIYLSTAAYGHFGKPDLPWEKIEAW
ncbi:MAG TPA: methionine adenosyltransferase [Candidatus Paceibacterota bacterium]